MLHLSNFQYKKYFIILRSLILTMSGEQINNKPSIMTYAAFPAITTGISAAHGITGARGIKNAIKLQNHQGFKKLANSIDTDVFTKSIKLSEEYEKHKSLVKDFNKWNNKLKAVKKGKLPLKDRFFNLFRKSENKITGEIIKTKAKDATKALNGADDAMNAIQTGTKAAKVGKEALEAGFKDSVKSLFKKEMTSKFNMVITALTHVPKIFNTVIPTFKEKGIVAGVKEAGKVVVQAATDFVSYGLGGAIGRTIGGVIGTVICPGVGSGIGAAIGDMVGSMFVGGKITKTVDKAIGAEDETQSDTIQNNQVNNENSPEQQALIQQQELRQQLAKMEENKLYMNM